jgi:hypothetical protein
MSRDRERTIRRSRKPRTKRSRWAATTGEKEFSDTRFERMRRNRKSAATHPQATPVARRIRMIRNLFASLVVALALGTVSAVLAQEIVPANHSHGGPVVVTEGTCQGGSCCQSCSPCVRVPIKVETIEYCSKCKEKCAGTCSIFGFLSGHCGCGSCDGGDCQTYCVRRLYKRAVSEETCDTKCVHVSELPAATPAAVLIVTVPAPAPAASPAPSAMPKTH